MNRVILIGNLGADAELKYTQGGQVVSNFTVCTTERWTKDGQKQEKSEWHRCFWWGKGAEAVSKYLEKGKKISVEGSLATRSWDDKNGVKHYATEIRVDNVELLSSNSDGVRGKNQDSRRNDYESQPDNRGANMPSDGDDIPF